MYENYSKEVVFGNVFIRFPVGKDGKMSGSRSWSSGDNIDTPFNFSISEFVNMSEYEPRESAPTKNRSAQINASWQFEKLKK